MKTKKRITSIALIAWFLFLIIFLSAWNADWFVHIMSRELKGITPENAKERTEAWDKFYTEYFRHKEPLAEVAGVSFLILNKQSTDNYSHIKDDAGNMQLLEDNFDHNRAETQILKLASAFEHRDIPFIFAMLPPRFDNDSFKVSANLDFFGQHDEHMLNTLNEANVMTLDAGEELKAMGARHLYPFKTDIHLETEGEIETAKLLSEKLDTLGIKIKDTDIIFDRNNYRIEGYPFAGNLVKSSGAVYTHGRDNFELWFPTFDTDLTVENPNPERGDERIRQGEFAESVMNGMDDPEKLAAYSAPYWVVNYLRFPSAYYTITNNRNPDGARLLIIIDSYALRMTSYLSLGAGHITVIDPRGEGSENYLSEAMEKGEYDAVIVCGGGKDFYESLEID